jgi:hypothetical protein
VLQFLFLIFSALVIAGSLTHLCVCCLHGKKTKPAYAAARIQITFLIINVQIVFFMAMKVYARFQVLTVASMKVRVFWVAALHPRKI